MIVTWIRGFEDIRWDAETGEAIEGDPRPSEGDGPSDPPIDFTRGLAVLREARDVED